MVAAYPFVVLFNVHLPICRPSGNERPWSSDSISIQGKREVARAKKNCKTFGIKSFFVIWSRDMSKPFYNISFIPFWYAQSKEPFNKRNVMQCIRRLDLCFIEMYSLNLLLSFIHSCQWFWLWMCSHSGYNGPAKRRFSK